MTDKFLNSDLYKRSWNTVVGETKAEFCEKKSIFKVDVVHVTSIEEANVVYANIKKREPTARHHCYAYTLGGENSLIYQKMSDDGEPKGTAGKPILDAILHNNLADTFICVTRYFGGILLGAGGLIRAYSSSAMLGINTANIVKVKAFGKYKLIISYPLLDSVKYFLKSNEIRILGEEYLYEVSLIIALDKDEVSLVNAYILEVSSGQFQLEFLDIIYLQEASSSKENYAGR